MQIKTNVEYVKLSKRFSNFKTIESLNTSIRQHLYNKKHLLTNSSITIFKRIARYAAKYKGVAFLKIATIIELTGFSRSTVIRALKLLQQLGIVLKRHVMRPVRGGNGSNMYVIQSYVPVAKNTSDTPPVTPREDVENVDGTSPDGVENDAETKIIKSLDNKDLIRMNATSAYDRFKSIVFSFIKNKDLLYKIYGVFKGQTKRLKSAYKEKELLDVALHALRTTFNKVKTKRIKNIPGYYNGVLSNCLNNLCNANEEHTEINNTLVSGVARVSKSEEHKAQLEARQAAIEAAATVPTEEETEEIYEDIQAMLTKLRAPE